MKVAGPGAWIYLSKFTPEVTVAFLGVPFNVVVACGLGAYASFSFGEQVKPRSRMLNVFIASVIVGCALTSITNASISHFLNVELLPGVRAGMGALVSCLSRFIIPAVIERIPNWLDRIPFLRKGKGE